MRLRRFLPDTLQVMRAQKVAAALGVLALVALSACGDDTDPEPSTPTPVPPEEQALRDVPLAQVVQGSFGAEGLTERGTALVAADGSLYRPLRRLIGHLYSPDNVTMAAFIDYEPSGPDGRRQQPAGIET